MWHVSLDLYCNSFASTALQVARNNFVKVKNIIIENEDREESVLLNSLFQALIKVCGEQRSTRLFAAPQNLNAQSIRAKTD